MISFVLAAAVLAASPLPTPEIFAPGVISGPQNDGAPTFTSDRRTLFFERSYGHRSIILQSQRSGEAWSRPQVAAFSGPSSDQQPALSPDGRTLVYVSSRRTPSPSGGPATASSHLWQVTRTADGGWSAPRELPPEVNISPLVFKPSVAGDGDLYFMSAPASAPGGPKWRLYRSALVGGAYRKAEPLSFSDGRAIDVDPFIAPDRSYLIFSSSGRIAPDDGRERLYVAVRKGDGWSEPRLLRYAGDDWGGDDGESQVGPGGDLYFTSTRTRPVDRTEARPALLKDIERNEAWDNGVGNAWKMPLGALFRANGVASLSGET